MNGGWGGRVFSLERGSTEKVAVRDLGATRPSPTTCRKRPDPAARTGAPHGPQAPPLQSPPIRHRPTLR